MDKLLERLNRAQSLASFRGTVLEEERAREVISTTAANVTLNPKGDLVLADNSRQFGVGKEGKHDLARAARIHRPFFMDCDPDLQAINFERRFCKFVGPETRVSLVISEGKVIRALIGELYHPPRGPMLNAVIAGTPPEFSPEQLKVMVYENNGVLDVGIISSSLTAYPRPGDIVAGGVAVIQKQDGAVAVGGAFLRLLCLNGATTRVCTGARECLRRPKTDTRGQEAFYASLADFVRSAWGQFADNAQGLAQLSQVSLSDHEAQNLLPRLRQAPFFLAEKLARDVIRKLLEEAREDGERPTLLDVWNAMTALGTHGTELSRRSRFLLRLGAGVMSRSRSPHICHACRQLVVDKSSEQAR